MGYGRLPPGEQLAGFRALVSRNPTLVEVLARAAVLALPGWYLVAGCLYQTVWNVVTGRPPEAGILDYDLVYFDATDVAWQAENAVIQAGHKLFGDLPAPVQIRNQARVHLWYEQKFGVPCPPHESTEAAIDTFEATTACLGGRRGPRRPQTASPPCPPWWCAPPRSSRPATSTRPRPPGGASNGRTSPSCPGRSR